MQEFSANELIKRLISIFILLLMIYNILGYYIVYAGLLLEAKSDMKEHIEEYGDDIGLTTLIFSIRNGNIEDKEINFENEDEFEYMGMMYDIVSSEIKNGFIYFYCINDRNEESIKSAITKHISDNFSNDPASQNRLNTLHKNIIKKCINDRSDIQVERINNNCLSFNHKISYLVSITPEIKTPPPKI